MKAKRSASLIALLMIAQALFSAAPATAAPEIKLLYPTSLYTGHVPELTDVQPNHFAAWVKELPPNPLVEFEVGPIGGGPLPGGGLAQTIDATRVGNSNTWQAFFTIPGSFPEGSQYEVRARLYSGQEAVASAVQTVSINKSDVPPAAQVVELTSPAMGDTMGFYTQGNQAFGILTGNASTDTDQVRVFYTLSGEGAAPAWKSCGSGRVETNKTFRARCTLAAGDAASGVTAVAAVANNTPPPSPPNQTADDAADAHRVFPYAQVPSSVFVNPVAIKTDPNTCLKVSALARDQFSRPIPGANIDVHAEGPNDQLRFARDDDTPVTNTTDDFQAPDKSHSEKEPAVKCSNFMADGEQGDHNVVGPPDRKHIESVDGTSDDGLFQFALYSGAVGTTSITAWVDSNNDDLMGNSEASGGVQVGWGENPQPPQLAITLQPTNPSAARGSCQRMEALARQGGNPVPNANIDVHAAGPDPSVTFCPVSDGSANRAPDQGEHTSGAHADGTKHIEGETDSFGRFTFGVLSSNEGSTAVTAWIDTTDDDIQASEPSQSATITWTPPGERSITLDVNKSSVRSGGTVKLFGSIDGDAACESAQTVKIKSRRPGRKFRNVSSAVSDDSGSYEAKVRVRRTLEFRTVVIAGGACSAAKSNIVKVKAT
ncbi:MAG: hypothetical protein QOG54_1422 [Actinomycetota bacterium]|jgi:hypothetical protein|nr:hypothetical protein [Actinomycetota bacterium]